MDMQQGGNAPVAYGRVAIRVTWATPADHAVEADTSAYLLTASGRVRDDADMIFYNQPSGADDAILFSREASVNGGLFEVDLTRLPGDIERVSFCVTLHEAQNKRQTLALLDGAEISAPGAEGMLRFVPSLADATEAAMVFGELYRRAGQWKFRAVGQGFNGGLAPLARSFGVDVAEERAALGQEAVPPPVAVPCPVRLSKISLEKPGQAVSLEKRGTSFGAISVNLNWSRARGGLFGGGGAIDLDIGCLFELADGRKGVVQALGNNFGSFDAAPYIVLSGDDRSGDVSEGETLRINGARWQDMRRIVVFANIYDGVPNWQRTDGVVLVTMPDQPPIEVRLSDGRNDKRLCGIVLLENDGGRLKATRHLDYVRDQQELDRQFGWGLRWVAGRKD
jgi:tellurite resistance protein TerA